MGNKKHLQISFLADVSGDSRPEVNITPIDWPISDDLAARLQEEIEKADATDSTPGNHQLDAKKTVKIPVHVSFATLNVPLKGTAVIKVVEK